MSLLCLKQTDKPGMSWVTNTRFFARQSSCWYIACDSHVDKCLSLACSILNVWNFLHVFVLGVLLHVWCVCLKVKIYLCIANCVISDFLFIWKFATALFHISGWEKICALSVIIEVTKARFNVVASVFARVYLLLLAGLRAWMCVCLCWNIGHLQIFEKQDVTHLCRVSLSLDYDRFFF